MTAYILTATSLLIAAGIHWKSPNSFWKATLLSTVAIVFISFLFLFVFPSNFLGLDSSQLEDGNIAGIALFISALSFFYGLLISVLVGYIMKSVRS